MKQSEAAFQQQCRISFNNKYPNLRGLLFHVRNNSESSRDGAYWKELGVIPGVSDFMFLFKGKCHCIELKTPYGNQSEAQVIWEKKVVSQGIDYYIVNSIQKFDSLIEKIVNS